MENAISWEPGSSVGASRAAQWVPTIAERVRAHECSAPQQSIQLREKNAARKFRSWECCYPCRKDLRGVGGGEKRSVTTKSHRFKSSRASCGCSRFVCLSPCRFIDLKCSKFNRLWPRRGGPTFGGRWSSSTTICASAEEEKVAKEACSQESIAARRCSKHSKHVAGGLRARTN